MNGWIDMTYHLQTTFPFTYQENIFTHSGKWTEMCCMLGSRTVCILKFREMYELTGSASILAFILHYFNPSTVRRK